MNDKNISLHSALHRDQIVKILGEQLDSYPSFAETLFILNARYWKGSSHVCGTIKGNEFEMRNRQGPGFSLIANGKLIEDESETQILLTFIKPHFLMRLQSLFLRRYEDDRKVIMAFLEEWLQTKTA